MTPTYRFAMRVCFPIVRTWGRLTVSGLEHLPRSGATLLAGNHDSYWDPIVVGVAALPRRQIRALAKSTLWDVPGLAPVLNGMGQIPIRRGEGDVGAFDRAIAELRSGVCIGVFPEGTTTRGRVLRARSGFGRLAAAVPEAEIVCVSIVGSTSVARFPERPRIAVRFFRPSAGARVDGESPAQLSARLLAEIRAEAPVVAAGRRGKTR
jgi:1-acyl-sn-glycerol-3-phosphate acyltransferase